MLPPPDRINYAEMRIQKVQIPVQVPIFKPIYVDYPYPNYVWTQDAQQATLLRAKQGMQTILANPQIKKYLINDDSSEESSDSESEEESQVQTQENKATLQNQQQVANNNINALNYVNGAQQFVNANQQIEVGQNQQIRPPIQLDYHDSGYQKSYTQAIKNIVFLLRKQLTYCNFRSIILTQLINIPHQTQSRAEMILQ